MKEQRWEFRYLRTDGKEKVCYPRSKEMLDKNYAVCKKCGFRVISCTKLYPINTYANQHNFSLIDTLCYNALHDMETGKTDWDDDEYARLTLLREEAENYALLPLPVAWLPYEKWKRAREIADTAVVHRQNACIANGRPDLVTYC